MKTDDVQKHYEKLDKVNVDLSDLQVAWDSDKVSPTDFVNGLEALTKYSKSVLAGEIKTETIVCAILEEDSKDVYEMSDSQFRELAADNGLTWSLFDFQCQFNCEGRLSKEEKYFWEKGQSYYYIRFIDVEVG